MRICGGTHVHGVAERVDEVVMAAVKAIVSAVATVSVARRGQDGVGSRRGAPASNSRPTRPSWGLAGLPRAPIGRPRISTRIVRLMPMVRPTAADVVEGWARTTGPDGLGVDHDIEG